MPDAIESELRLFGNPPESQRQRGLVSHAVVVIHDETMIPLATGKAQVGETNL
jgi:hypothetical protein